MSVTRHSLCQGCFYGQVTDTSQFCENCKSYEDDYPDRDTVGTVWWDELWAEHGDDQTCIRRVNWRKFQEYKRERNLSKVP
jgi:hypothetical protein